MLNHLVYTSASSVHQWLKGQPSSGELQCQWFTEEREKKSHTCRGQMVRSRCMGSAQVKLVGETDPDPEIPPIQKSMDKQRMAEEGKDFRRLLSLIWPLCSLRPTSDSECRTHTTFGDGDFLLGLGINDREWKSGNRKSARFHLGQQSVRGLKLRIENMEF